MRTLSCILGLACLALPGFAAAPPVATVRVDALGDPFPQGAIARLGSARFRVNGPDRRTQPVCPLSPDGKLVAAADLTTGKPRICLVDATGRVTRSFSTGANHGPLAFSPDGKILFAADFKSMVYVHDVATGKELRHFDVKPGQASLGVVSADGTVLAVPQPRSRVRMKSIVVHDVRSGKRLARLDLDEYTYAELALSPDGKALATYRSGNNRDATVVQLWDTPSGKKTKTLAIAAEVDGVAFSPDSKTLVVAAEDELQIWDVASGKRLKKWERQADSSPGSRLAFSPDGKRVVLGSKELDSGVAVWDVTAGRRVPVALAPRCEMQGFAFRQDRITALGVRGQALILWDVLSAKRFDRGVGHVAAVEAIVIRGGRIVTADRGGDVLEWDTSGKLLGEMPQPSRERASLPSRPITFSPEGTYLVRSHDGQVNVTTVESGKQVLRLGHSFHERDATRFPPAFSRDGKLVAVAGFDDAKNRAEVSVLRTDSGKRLLGFEPGAGRLAGLAFDSTGERLAVALATENRGESSCSVLVWRIDKNQEEAAVRRYQVPVQHRDRVRYFLAFSPDGARLAVGSDRGGPICLLDAATGKGRATILTGARGTLVPIFSPDGRSLAVTLHTDVMGSSVALWEVRTGEKRWEMPLPALPTALAFDPSGRLLVTAHVDTTALVWDVAGRDQMHKQRDAKGWDALVNDLSSGDATKAFAAQRALAAGANLSVEQMAKRVKRAEGRALSDKELAALMKDLDDDEREVRGKAFDELEEQGKVAEAALSKALKGKPSAELRRSATALLDRIRWGGTSPDALRAARAVEVLEWIGTPEAKRLLTDLAAGRAGATITLEAKAALARLCER